MEQKVINVSGLKVGNYCIIDNIACVVKSIQTSKTGKHGHAKCRIEAIGIVDSQKKVIVLPGHDKMVVPIIEKKAAQILSIHDETANVMDMETFETFDLKIPEDIKGNIREGVQVIYWDVLGNKVMKQIK
ncbi:translation initiation factor IF-5A [Candidatus Woesearchaeota archaeon]|nr:translation initiation factor IF-5A [Candidatus Woesearchaeota archaeon]